MNYTTNKTQKSLNFLDCPALTSPHQISLLQDEAIKIMLEKCGGSRMAHILLTMPFIRIAGDGKLLQVSARNRRRKC